MQNLNIQPVPLCYYRENIIPFLVSSKCVPEAFACLGFHFFPPLKPGWNASPHVEVSLAFGGLMSLRPPHPSKVNRNTSFGADVTEE